MFKKSAGMTLLEVLMVVILMGIMATAFFNIHVFTQGQVIQADHRSKVQNELTLVLDHMNKHISASDTSGGAIGDWNNLPVIIGPLTSGDNGIIVRVDSNQNGKLDVGVDTQIAYGYNNGHILFYPNYPGAPDDLTPGGTVMGDFNDIPNQNANDLSFVSYDPAHNYIEVQLTGRWSINRGSALDNPQITVRNRIVMPSVSVSN